MKIIEHNTLSLRAIYSTYAHAINAAILLFLVLIAFGRSLNHGFVWDDNALIVNSDLVTQVQNPGTVFARSFWTVSEDATDVSRSFYRPLVSLSYMIDLSVWGLNPQGFHLTNLLFHSVAVLMVYILALNLLGGPFRALLATALFAIHPVHVENVSWISGRTDIICAIFFVPAFLLFVKWCNTTMPSGHLVAAAALMYFLALLGKEMAISFPLLALLYYASLTRASHPWKRTLYPGILFSLVTLFYLVIRLIALGRLSSPPLFGELWQRIATIPVVLTKYLGLLVMLQPVDPHHSDELVSSLAATGFLLPAILACAYIALTAALAVKKQSTLSFYFAFVPVALLPVFNLATFGDILIADRFLYIPSIGFAFGIVALGAKVLSDGEKAGSALKFSAGLIYGLFVACLIYSSWINSAYWRSNLMLFSRAAATSPRSAYVHFNLANTLHNEGRLSEACVEYGRAISLAPDYPEAFINMGMTLKESGLYEHSITYLGKAIQLYDDRIHGRQRSVPTIGLERDPLAGARLSTESLEVRRACTKNQCFALTQMADAFRKAGKMPDALKAYKTVISLDPSYEAYNNIGECLLQTGNPEMAYGYFLKALQLRQSPLIYNNLGMICVRLQHYDKALAYLNKALGSQNSEINSELTAAIHYNLAQAYFLSGQKDSAAINARRALSLIARGWGPAASAKELRQWIHEASTNAAAGDRVK